MRMDATDLFDGVFDNTSTMRREFYINGELRHFVRATLESKYFGMVGPWGLFPDRPKITEESQ